MKTKQKKIMTLKIVFLSFIIPSYLFINSFAAEINQNSNGQVKDEKASGVSRNTLNDIIIKLRQQEFLLKNNVVLHYTITETLPDIPKNNSGDVNVNKSYKKQETTAILSGVKAWEESTRFGVDGNKTLTSSFSWNGTSGKRLIVSENTGEKKGWKKYNPASTRSNPTSTQNLLLILGFLGTQEQSLSEFIENHYKEIEISQRDSEIFLTFSALNGTLDYSVVLDSNHSFWPKQIIQIYRNAKEDGIDLGDIKFEYTDIEFGQTDLGDAVAFYPKKMRYISYLNSEMLNNEKMESSTELTSSIIDEISIQSIDFKQDIQNEQFQLDFPDNTVIY